MDSEIRFEAKNLQFNLMVFGIAWALRRQGSLPHMMPWFGQSEDAADGRLYLGRRLLAPWRRRLKIGWKSAGSRHAVDTLFATHCELARAIRGRPLAPVMWTVLRSLVTPHPLGGCRMADSSDGRRREPPRRGVRLPAPVRRGRRDRAVRDGPQSSKTIAALAERIADHMIA